MKKLVLLLCLFFATLLLTVGCSSEGEKFGPPPSDLAWLFGGGSGGSGGGSAPAAAPAAQPIQAQPIQPAQQLPATALAESLAKRYPRATAEDFREIEGEKEVHHAKDPGECIKLLLWFQQHGFKMRLEVKANPMPGNRKQSVCVFWGKEAQVQRFGYNDAYEATLTPYPTSVNEYEPNPAQYDPLDKPNPQYHEDPALHEYGKTLTPAEREQVPFTNKDAAKLDRPTPQPQPSKTSGGSVDFAP